MAKDVRSYKDSGVDIEKGDRFADFIKNINSNVVNKAIGGFAGGIPLNLKDYDEPILLSCTDGVGTKLLVAQKLNDYSTIGIDLVAMSVNDLVVAGAEPLVFLDYIACGKINEATLQEVMKGIVKGCELAESQLSGGETAEMPDMYAGDDIDLAGFAVGIAEKKNMLPKKEKITGGEIILGLPSSGIHSNGFSLARKVIPETKIELRKKMLIPTRIYVKEMKGLLSTGKILAAAHITGGGLEGNLQRVIPDNMVTALDYSWRKPEIFDIIETLGNIPGEEMKKVFNLGIGMAVIIKEEDADEALNKGKEMGFEIFPIGKVVKR